jgi:uncharacterized protein YqhQ
LSKNGFKTSIGGQALIEGVMMRGPEESAMAVRLPGGDIDVEIFPTKNPTAWYRKAPFIRGSFNMVDSLAQGYKCLMKSAEKSGMEEDAEPGKFEKWVAKKTGKDIMSVVSVVALALGGAIAILLFMMLPAFIVGFLSRFVPLEGSVAKSLTEGAVKIAVFLLYLTLVSRLGEIRRVFMYHGAEHKTIACYEAGEELTVENVRTKKRFHPRCGTSFLLIVLVVSILVFSVVTWSSVVLRVLLKLLMLPLVVGVAYEIIKLAGRFDNILTRAISAPGIWLQRLTTVEPDDSQIEVAIASMLPAIPKEKGSDEW